MEYENELAQKVGRGAGFALSAGALITYMSIYRILPPPYVWLSAVLLWVAVYFAMSAILLLFMLGKERQTVQQPPIIPQPIIMTEITVDEMAPSAPAVAQMEATRYWMEQTDWDGLSAYAQQPDATFSRAAVEQWVDQRFYSPRDGDAAIPFPELMVRIGAARKLGVNGGTRYLWTEEASSAIKRLGKMHTPLPSPTG